MALFDDDLGLEKTSFALKVKLLKLSNEVLILK